MKSFSPLKSIALLITLAFFLAGCFFGRSTGTDKQTENSANSEIEESEIDADDIDIPELGISAPEAPKDESETDVRSIVPKEGSSGSGVYDLHPSDSPLPLKSTGIMKKGGRSRLEKAKRAPAFKSLGSVSAMISSRIQPPFQRYYPDQDTESYTDHGENPFKKVLSAPLSTFSIDVDVAAYGNIRRFINRNRIPPADAVRIEEMINYFSYDYKSPKGEHPFAVTTEAAPAPWNTKHKLVHIGLKGKELPKNKRPPSNLVFLLDVSGSMNTPNKLPLLVKSLGMLVEQLGKKDKVSIAVYAGAAGCVLEPTPGNDKRKIMEALNKLSAGGSTAGGAGIKLAYSLARESFIKKGNNRVILATDGDFNVGASSDKDMEELIEEQRKSGVFLTVLGFGMGNYKDSKMEILADKGNGNYAYIDNILESKKVFVQELGSTLFTIAKDVKLQVEFNPKFVSAYRLIGYENRKLKDADFNNDKKDAGELGAGHTVTALYEIIPVGVTSEFTDVDPLKYQKPENYHVVESTEILTVKLRYKKPDGDKSILLSRELNHWDTAAENASENFRWSAAVASFGMLLKKSEYLGKSTYASALKLAQKSKGNDDFGYRAEFIRMMEKAELLAGTEVSRSGSGDD